MHEPRGSTRPVFNPSVFLQHKAPRSIASSHLDLAWEKQPTSRDASTGIPAKWRLRNERRNSLLTTPYHPDLGSTADWSPRVENVLWPISSTTEIWVVTRHQYGIPAFVPKTSFHEGISSGIAKCPLFSQDALDGILGHRRVTPSSRSPRPVSMSRPG